MRVKVVPPERAKESKGVSLGGKNREKAIDQVAAVGEDVDAEAVEGLLDR